MEAYDRLWQQTRCRLPWGCLFVTPFWLDTVVSHLGSTGDPLLLAVTHDQEVVGIVPLSISGDTAFFLGIPDVCDYQDFVIAAGHEAGVLHHMQAYLSEMGVRRLDLQTLRPDAAVLELLESCENAAYTSISRQPTDVTYEATLPGAWDDYLMQLTGKQRHEVRRKVRRLEAHGAYRFRMADPGQGLDEAVAQFLRLFHLNRQDKSRFMDDTMGGYFRELITRLAQQKMLRLYFLDVDDRPAAAVLCFDYNGTRYLYNSGYDAAFQELSVGILSKVFSIQRGIEDGCHTYDFLKGAEAYKKRIGGQEMPLYRYRIEL